MKPGDADEADRALVRATRRHRRWWALGGLIAVAVGLLLAGDIVTVNRRIRVVPVVLGNTTLVPGQQAAFRVAAFDIDAQDDADQLTAGLALLGPLGRRIPLGHGDSHGQGSVDLDVQIPRDVAGCRWSLEARVASPAGRAEPERFSILLATHPPPTPGAWLQRRNACEEGSLPGGPREVSIACDICWFRPQRPPSRRGGSWPSPLCAEAAPLVRLYPVEGYLHSRMPNRVIAWFPGRPRVATWQELGYRRPPGLGRPAAPGPVVPLPLDALGVGVLQVTPDMRRGPLRLGADGRTEIESLRVLPNPLAVHPHHVLLSPGSRVEVDAEGEVPNRYLYLEIWAKGAWIASGRAPIAFAPAPLKVSLPRGLRGFVALRAYTNQAGPVGDPVDRLLWVAPHARSPDGLRRLARAVAALPGAESLALHAPDRYGPDPLLAAVAAAPDDTLVALGDAGRETLAEAILSRVEVVPWAAPQLHDPSSTPWSPWPRQQALEEADERSGRAATPTYGILAVAAALALGASLAEASRQSWLPAAIQVVLFVVAIAAVASGALSLLAALHG